MASDTLSSRFLFSLKKEGSKRWDQLINTGKKFKVAHEKKNRNKKIMKTKDWLRNNKPKVQAKVLVCINPFESAWKNALCLQWQQNPRPRSEVCFEEWESHGPVDLRHLRGKCVSNLWRPALHHSPLPVSWLSPPSVCWHVFRLAYDMDTVSFLPVCGHPSVLHCA